MYSIYTVYLVGIESNSICWESFNPRTAWMFVGKTVTKKWSEKKVSRQNKTYLGVFLIYLIYESYFVWTSKRAKRATEEREKKGRGGQLLLVFNAIYTALFSFLLLENPLQLYRTKL